MKVTFYKFSSQYDGYHIQREVVDKVEYLSKSEVMKLADLRHPVLTKREFYDTLSTDIKGNVKEEFDLLSHLHLLVVEPFVKTPKI